MSTRMAAGAAMAAASLLLPGCARAQTQPPLAAAAPKPSVAELLTADIRNRSGWGPADSTSVRFLGDSSALPGMRLRWAIYVPSHSPDVFFTAVALLRDDGQEPVLIHTAFEWSRAVGD